MSDPVCVNAHDRCYEGGPCPLCEPAPSWQQKMKDTIATLTAERDRLREALRGTQEIAVEHFRRAARLEEALRACVKWAEDLRPYSEDGSEMVKCFRDARAALAQE